MAPLFPAALDDMKAMTHSRYQKLGNGPIFFGNFWGNRSVTDVEGDFGFSKIEQTFVGKANYAKAATDACLI